MRVLIWTDSDRFAGTEQHCLDLAAGLEEQGCEVTVGCRSGSPLSERVQAKLGRTLDLNADRAPLQAVGALRSGLRSGEFDLVHAHNGRTALLAACAKRAERKGHLVVTQHFIEPAHVARRGLSKLLSERVHALIRSEVSAWIAISESVKEGMLARKEASPALVHRIWNGSAPPPGDEPSYLEARRMLGVTNEDPVILCVARLEKEKRHETLLNALSILQAEGTSFRAALLGEGARRHELEQMVHSLGLAWRVQFAGQQASPGVWMRGADAMVLPSSEEPFGLVLLEAMSRGLPVLAANGGGPREVVDPSCGLLFEPGDARGLAVRLQSLMTDRLLARALSAGGRKRWEELFQRSAMAKEVNSLYRRLKSGQASPDPKR